LVCKNWAILSSNILIILTFTALKFTALNGKCSPLELGNITPFPINWTAGFKLVNSIFSENLSFN
jgi:hypothetical protein